MFLPQPSLDQCNQCGHIGFHTLEGSHITQLQLNHVVATNTTAETEESRLQTNTISAVDLANSKANSGIKILMCIYSRSVHQTLSLGAYLLC